MKPSHRLAVVAALSLLIAAPSPLAQLRTPLKAPPPSDPMGQSPTNRVPPDLPEAGTPTSTAPPPESVLALGGSITFHVTGDEKRTYQKPVSNLLNSFYIANLVIGGAVLVNNGVVTGVNPQVAAGDLSSLDPTLSATDPETASAITSFAFDIPAFYSLIDVDNGSYHGDSTLVVSPLTPWPRPPGPFPYGLPVSVCKVRPVTVPTGGGVGDLDMAPLYDCGLVSAQDVPDTTPGMDNLKIQVEFYALPGRLFTIEKKL